MATSVTFDIYARDRASGELKKIGSGFNNVGSSAKKNEGHLASFGTTLKKVAGAFLLLEAAKKAAEVLKSSVEAAAQNQAAQAHLALALENTTGATKRQVAATQDWITKQALATGDAKTDLDPALQHLAESTGSVTKAQKELHLAMDVSAGTGRSLSSVTLALVKANNGSLGGLGRFGIQTQKTTMIQGKAVKSTLTLNQVTKELSKTFGGQAKTQAQTYQGQLNRLGVQWEEAKVAIGDHLLPVLTKMGTWFFSTGIPAIKRFGQAIEPTVTQVENKLGPALQNVGSVLLHDVLPVLEQYGQWLTTKVVPATVQLATKIGKNLAPTVTTLVAQFRKSEPQLKAFWKNIQPAVVIVAKFAAAILVAASYVVGKLLPVLIKLEAAFLRRVLPVVASFIGTINDSSHAAMNFAGSLIHGVEAAGRFASGIATKVGAALKIVMGIPNRVTNALGNLGSLLFNAGKQVIQGLINGVDSMIGSLESKLHSITKLIPLHKGPIEKDRALLQPAGVAIMEGLIKGIQSRQVALTAVLGKVTAQVQASGSKLKNAISARNQFASGFQGFASSAFGADYGTDANGNPNAPTIASILAFQQSQASTASTVNTDVHRLVKLGLSPALIKQLQSAGSSGMAEIQALASATPSQIKQFNALNKQTTASLRGAGMAAGNAIYGQTIRKDERHQREVERLLQQLVHLTAHPGKYEITLNGKHVDVVLAQHRHNNGGHLQSDKKP